MGLEMIDGDQRFLVDQRDRLGGGKADHDAADEAGAGGGGNAIEFGEGDTRGFQGAPDEHIERLDMGPGGDFRHDAAIAGMFVDLGIDFIGKYGAGPVIGAGDDSGGGFVAGGLQPQDANLRHQLPFGARGLVHPRRRG